MNKIENMCRQSEWADYLTWECIGSYSGTMELLVTFIVWPLYKSCGLCSASYGSNWNCPWTWRTMQCVQTEVNKVCTSRSPKIIYCMVKKSYICKMYFPARTLLLYVRSNLLFVAHIEVSIFFPHDCSYVFASFHYKYQWPALHHYWPKEVIYTLLHEKYRL